MMCTYIKSVFNGTRRALEAHGGLVVVRAREGLLQRPAPRNARFLPPRGRPLWLRCPKKLPSRGSNGINARSSKLTLDIFKLNFASFLCMRLPCRERRKQKCKYNVSAGYAASPAFCQDGVGCGGLATATRGRTPRGRGWPASPPCRKQR